MYSRQSLFMIFKLAGWENERKKKKKGHPVTPAAARWSTSAAGGVPIDACVTAKRTQ
jgi:hypothetical protein